MGSPKIHPQGYWLSHQEGHHFDVVLAQELTLLLDGKSVCDFGCGLGKYVHWLRNCGVECDGYDGNPNTNEISLGACRSLNLAERFQLEKQYDAVMCLEVGEHLPKEYETVLLNNLTSHAREMIVLSWAIPGQPGNGHVNCRMNSYLIYQMWRRGFRFQPITTASLRSHCSLPWFSNTLMAFSRDRTWFSVAEWRAAGEIIVEDVHRLDRSNSSLVGASIGKISRICWRLMRKVRAILRTGSGNKVSSRGRR
jgi:hypothetical protein